MNHPLDLNQELNSSYFEVNVNSESIEISDIEFDEENPQVILISLDMPFSFLDDITVSFFQENQIQSTLNNYLSVFSDFPVYNNITERILIPGIVQVEDFSYQEGFTVSETSDINGGYKLGYTDAGDFAEYLVLITESGEYNINYRIASAYDPGSLTLELIDGSNIQYLPQTSFPVTGDWESWETVSTSANLNAGSYKLKMRIIQSGFDINWIEFDYVGGSMGLQDEIYLDFILYPNPSQDYINLETDLNDFIIEIYDMLGKKVYVSQNQKRINIMQLDSGMYFLNLSSKFNSTSKLFIKK